MPLTDYLIDQAGIDWATVLGPLHALLPSELTVWLVNRYGDVVFVRDDGSVSMLDVGGTAVKRLADSRAHLTFLVDESGNANDWLMIPLVDKCVAAGLRLQPGQCYSYRQPPLLGGNYTVANTVIMPLAEHYAFYGMLYDRTKDLPDGTKVEFRVTS
jgi:hypothetical protein